MRMDAAYWARVDADNERVRVAAWRAVNRRLERLAGRMRRTNPFLRRPGFFPVIYP